MSSMSVEIEIPVPWGIIAGKSWNDPKNPIVVAFHGFQDNANTFDRLIPLLPKTFHYVCLDLPCHGKSSHFVTKSLITSFDFILSIKLILDHLKHKKYILLGHSFGGQLITFFTQVYPEYVDRLICLDSYYMKTTSAGLLIKNLREIINKYEKLHNLSDETAPTYKFDEAVRRMMSARFVKISEDAARVIISRSLIPVGDNRSDPGGDNRSDPGGDNRSYPIGDNRSYPVGDNRSNPIGDNKYKISTSQQLKYNIRPPFSIEYEVDLLREHPIRCPFLMVTASAETSKHLESFVLPVMKEFKKNPYYVLRTVDGSHDVHIDHPERVAPLIADFLLKFNSKL